MESAMNREVMEFTASGAGSAPRGSSLRRTIFGYSKHREGPYR